MSDWRETRAEKGADGKRRCSWGDSAPEYIEYHDREWGRPVFDDVRIFEQVCLEGFQSGLSWITILRKRAAFRRAFVGFDPDAVARFGGGDVERLLDDASIVRNRRKIESAINNARAMREVRSRHGSLADLMWSFAPKTRRLVPTKLGEVPPETPESKALAKELKRCGFTFVGPTTMYAAMQSLGVVNDHLRGCHVRGACDRERREALLPPRPSRG